MFLNGISKLLYYHNSTLSSCHNEKNNKSLWQKMFFGSCDPTCYDFKILDFYQKAFTEICTNIVLKIDRNEHTIWNRSPRYGCRIAIADLIDNQLRLHVSGLCEVLGEEGTEEGNTNVGIVFERLLTLFADEWSVSLLHDVHLTYVKCKWC